MATEKVATERPQTLSGLFALAQENLKKKGVERQLPSASNYLASSQTNRRLLDAIELKRTMAIYGCPDLSAINRSLLDTSP